MPTYRVPWVLATSETSACCCGCCPYPYSPSFDGIIPATDLPPTLIIEGVPVSYNGDYSYGTIAVTDYVYLLEDNWYIATLSSRDYRSDCLIGTFTNLGETGPVTIEVDYDVSDTLTVGATTLTRVSNCRWTGGGRVLAYNSTTYKWQLDGVNKTDPQDGPTGTYGAETVA